MFHLRGLSPATIASLLYQSLLRTGEAPRHVFLCVVDHFEPMWQGASPRVQRQRVNRWRKGYPALVDGLGDSNNRPPQHTFFYPVEDYHPEHLDVLSEIRAQGHGDVEVHLHHDQDTSQQLRDTLQRTTEVLHDRHGLLRRRVDGQISYGFVHGNWALDNSRPDGRWCGVNDELSVLVETGCYADFTMPSAPNPCQTRTINSIYYAIDDPQAPKSHDRGEPAQVGRQPPPQALLMVQGPLMFDWTNRKWFILPRVENGDLQGKRAATWNRLRLWQQAGVGVVGRPDWLFIKIHTHGCDEANADILLGEPMREFHHTLRRYVEAQPNLKYYYVTAHEMAMLVRQAERGVQIPQFPVAETVSGSAQTATLPTSAVAVERHSIPTQRSGTAGDNGNHRQQ